jgi:hypothetical protein
MKMNEEENEKGEEEKNRKEGWFKIPFVLL